ncbi:hypothetical protein D9M68_899090 [compost metagenome]
MQFRHGRQPRPHAMLAQAQTGALQEVVGHVAMQREAFMHRLAGDLPTQFEVHVRLELALLDLVVQHQFIGRIAPDWLALYGNSPRCEHAFSYITWRSFPN